MSSFVPIRKASSKVIIDLSTRRQALRDATKRLDKGAGVDMNSPVAKPGFLMTALEGTAALATDKWVEREKLAKEERRAKGRQLVAQGAAMIRDEDGINAADEWLTKCMSKGE